MTAIIRPMIEYGYDECKEDTLALIGQISDFKPDTVIGIARGGIMLAQHVGYGLDLRNVQCIRVESYDDKNKREEVTILDDCDLSQSRRAILVDDICDSGDTLRAVLEYLKQRHPDTLFKTATLFTKPTACMQPDYSVKEATGWINFFWECDFTCCPSN